MKEMERMNEKGFTLVELMVVLAILGLLAGIGVPQYMKTLERSRQAADNAALAAFQSAVDAFIAETGFEVVLTSGTVEPADFPKTASILGTGDVEFSEFWTGDPPKATQRAIKGEAPVYTAVKGQLAWPTPVGG